jgi:hypothetical protein
MNKRLTGSDYLFTLIFIFMIILAVCAFFFGIKIGHDKAASNYDHLIMKQQQLPHELIAYHQQYLVSFYHTIYTPYQEFQKKWFDHIHAIEYSSSVDPSSILRELGRLSGEKYESTLTKTMPDSSPLLKSSHENYLKSLKLFNEAAKRIQSRAALLSRVALVAEIQYDAFFQEAKNFALQAQSQYYSAIVQWHINLESNVISAEGLSKFELPLDEWNGLPLNVKNEYVALYLLDHKQFLAFKPQDLSSRIDEMIRSEQTKRLNLAHVTQVIDMLLVTGAVRNGDFNYGKSRWYAEEFLPQLPFFFEIY